MAIHKKWFHFLSPIYWPMWLAIGLMRLSALLPYSALLVLGKGLGYLIMLILPKRKKVTEINLALCFPQLTTIERKKLLRKNYYSVGIGFFELALAWFASDDRLKKMIVVPNTIENLIHAKAANKGVLIATCHFTMIELGIRLLSFYTPLNVMYRPQKNELFEWMLQKCRQKYVREGITRHNIRGMLRALKQTDAVMCYTPDQDMGREATVFAPFFGVFASTVIGTNYFIKKTGAALVPGFYYRDEKNKQYILDCHLPLDQFPSDNEIVDATRLNKIIEEAISKHPEQYMWQHRRFKTRPEGEEIFY